MTFIRPDGFVMNDQRLSQEAAGTGRRTAFERILAEGCIRVDGGGPSSRIADEFFGH